MATYSIIGTPGGMPGVPVILESGIPANRISARLRDVNAALNDCRPPDRYETVPRWYLVDQAAANLHPTVDEWEAQREAADGLAPGTIAAALFGIAAVYVGYRLVGPEFVELPHRKVTQ